MSPYKNERSRSLGQVTRPINRTSCPYSNGEFPFRLAPLLPENVTPIPEEFWLIHRYRKGGVR